MWNDFIFRLGQNLFTKGGTGAIDVVAFVNAWHKEIDNYNYDADSCSSVCGHYTQVCRFCSFFPVLHHFPSPHCRFRSLSLSLALSLSLSFSLSFSLTSLGPSLKYFLRCIVTASTITSNAMSGVLDYFFELLRLNRAGDNLGLWDDFFGWNLS